MTKAFSSLLKTYNIGPVTLDKYNFKNGTKHISVISQNIMCVCIQYNKIYAHIYVYNIIIYAYEVENFL